MPTPILAKNKTGVYEARWSDNRRTRRKSMGVKDRTLAETRFAQWLLMGGHVAHKTAETSRAAKLTIGELWTAYERDHLCNVASPETSKTSWKALAPEFSSLYPSDLSQARVDGFVKRCLSQKSTRYNRTVTSGTVRKWLVALRACLNWSADNRRKLIAKDDVPDFDLPADNPPRERWLTTEEMDKIFAAAAEMRGHDGHLTRVERFLWLAMQTAARRMAIRELTWDRVDFEVGMIHYPVPGQRETKKRRVSVPISKALRPILERAYAERTGDLVVDAGGDLWYDVQKVVIHAGLGKKGPKGNVVATGISPHTMRHTAATHMARRNVPLWVIAGVLGNSMAIVERVYAKHVPGAKKAAVDMISGDAE